MRDAHDVVGGDDADLGAVEAPLGEDVEDNLLAAFFGDEEHALLRFGEHDLVAEVMPVSRWGTRSSSIETPSSPRAPISQVEQVRPAAPMSWMPRTAPVFMASRQGLEEELFEEGVAHLDVGALLLGAFGELFGGHGCAVDAVASGLGARRRKTGLPTPVALA